jgi:ABC-type glycerol-3-phosphate transport system permease component
MSTQAETPVLVARSTATSGRRGSLTVSHVVAVALLTALSAAVLIPILYTISTALGTSPWNGYGADTSVLFGSLQAAWQYGLLPGSLVNSVITSSGAVVVLWIVCSMAAYSFALMKWRGREVLFLVVLASLLVPVQVIMFPLFVEFRDFGLVNSYQGLILGFVVFGIPLTTFQFAAYFKTLPYEVLDAARVDGASTLQTLFRVVLPMSRPILAVTGIINFVWTWNDVLLPFMLTQDSERKPLVAQLAVTTGSQFVSSSTSVLAAIALFGFLPTVVVYIVAQRQIVRGITAGAIK